MDPFSISTGISGCLPLALELVKILKDFTSQVESAPKEAHDLLMEITALSRALEKLIVFLRKEHIKGIIQETSTLCVVIAICKSMIESLHPILVRFQVSGEKMLIRLSGHLRWPLKKQNCIEVVEILHRCTETIEFSLTIANCEFLFKTSREVMLGLSQQKQQTESLMAIFPVIPAEISKMSTTLGKILSFVSTIDQLSIDLAQMKLGLQSLQLDTDADNKGTLGVRLPLEGANVNMEARDKHGRTLLSHAAGEGHASTVRILLERPDVDAEARDKHGRTPVSYAAGQGHCSVVRVLLARADVKIDSRDKHGRTPFSYAAVEGRDAMVSLLLERADVDKESRDKHGRTPLSYAAGAGRVAVVSLLIERADVDIEARDKHGRTPLSYAAGEGHDAVVRLLLQRPDVNIDSEDKHGRNPLSYAAAGGRDAVMRLLLGRPHVGVKSQGE